MQARAKKGYFLFAKRSLFSANVASSQATIQVTDTQHFNLMSFLDKFTV